MTADDSYLELRNVSKSYGGATLAVDDISLNVRKGEFVTFLGPSGSGKTTTLTMIAGFETLTAGAIRLDGQDLTQLPPWHRDIGMVFQNYALFPHMTVASNVSFPLRMRRLPKDESRRRVNDVLELVGLAHLAQKHPRELSGGQQQRVALARALVFKPRILLLDEPLGALDKNLREQMQIEITRIHREVGITTLYVTHDQDEAMTMSDRVAVFNGGRIDQVGAPLEVYRHPRTKFVAQFVGDNNLFEISDFDAAGARVVSPVLGTIAVTEHIQQSNAGKRWFLIRPEEIQVSSAEGRSAPANAITITVQNIIHYGSDCIVIGDIGNAAQLRVRVPASQAESISLGSRLSVGWERSAGIVV